MELRDVQKNVRDIARKKGHVSKKKIKKGPLTSLFIPLPRQKFELFARMTG